MVDLYNLETQVFSLIKAKFSPKIKEKYTDLNFTTVDKSISGETKFPTVYVHMMESPEIGETLEGTVLNGVNVTFQVKSTDNESQTKADEVSKEVLRIMKSIGFKAVGIPFHDNQGNEYCTASRYRRPIGSGDIL